MAEVFLWIKDPVFSQIRIQVTQKDRIPMNPNPDPQHWFGEPNITCQRYFNAESNLWL